MDRWSKEKRDKHQGQSKGVEVKRGPRLDAPGTLHHVIVRGIARAIYSLLQSGSRRPPLPKLRRAIALKLINEYGESLAETARRLGISKSGVAEILTRSGYN